MKTALYVRVSTEEQAKHGYSIAAQKEKLEAYCKSQDWSIADIYADEGKSAKDIERPALKRMISDIKEKKIDVVLVYRLDRLTRSVLDLYKLLDIFEEYDCKFKSATEVYDTTTATGRLFITLVAALAQWERENLAERVKMGMTKSVSMGKWSGGKSPYGYVYENGSFKVNEEEAKVVKEIFHLAKYNGFDHIAKMLNKRPEINKKFAGYTVHYIATNPFYMGKQRFNEERYQVRRDLNKQQIFDADHPAIIKEEEFWETQKYIKRRREESQKYRHSTYYFTGVLKCARCGYAITGSKVSGEKYYRCSGKKKVGCKLPVIKEETLTEKILSEFNNLVEWIKEEAETDNDVDKKQIEKEIKSLQRKMDKYRNMYVNDLISMEDLNKNIRELREKEKELQQQIAKSIENVDLSLLKDFHTIFYKATAEEKQMLIKSIFTAIILDVDDIQQAPGRRKPVKIIGVK